MLSAANDIALSQKHQNSITAIELVGESLEETTLVGGMGIRCNKTISENFQSDLIFIPSIWRKPKQACNAHVSLIKWLSAQYENGATICAIANGAFFAAEAGILDGKPATTHWRYFREFAASYPKIKLQRKRFTTNADRIYCTGSVNAIRDIMLHFIAQLYSPTIATEIAQHFTHELKPSFESELLAKDQKSTHNDELIIAVQEWFISNFQNDLTVGEVAARFGLSIRSLNRRFKQATGTTPLQYLQTLRLDHAKQLLKQSNLVIAEVAGAVGYQDTSYFSELFKRTNSLTPKQYRQLVRDKVFAAEAKQPE